MNFQRLIDQLQNLKFNKAISEAARQEIAPYRELTVSPEVIGKAREAGVLLHFHSVAGKAYYTLIERPEYSGTHSNQISLPGGKKEKEDQNIIATALREAQEEVNIARAQVRLLGSLSSIYIPPSNFYVTPVLGYSEQVPNFQPDAREVKSIIHAPVSQLLEINLIKRTKVSVGNGLSMETNYLDIEGKIVWGATALILNDLRWYLKEFAEVN